jgi:hypothetical protein
MPVRWLTPFQSGIGKEPKQPARGYSRTPTSQLRPSCFYRQVLRLLAEFRYRMALENSQQDAWRLHSTCNGLSQVRPRPRTRRALHHWQLLAEPFLGKALCTPEGTQSVMPARVSLDPNRSRGHGMLSSAESQIDEQIQKTLTSLMLS